MGLRVHQKSKLSFETKYVLKLLDRILINTWRAEVSVMVLQPWLTQYVDGDVKTPTFTQIKKGLESHHNR